jgi:hypothetical protein
MGSRVDCVGRLNDEHAIEDYTEHRVKWFRLFYTEISLFLDSLDFIFFPLFLRTIISEFGKLLLLFQILFL